MLGSFGLAILWIKLAFGKFWLGFWGFGTALGWGKLSLSLSGACFCGLERFGNRSELFRNDPRTFWNGSERTRNEAKAFRNAA